MANYLFSYTAEQHPADAPPPVRSHHNEVHIVLGCIAQNGRCCSYVTLEGVGDAYAARVECIGHVLIELHQTGHPLAKLFSLIFGVSQRRKLTVEHIHTEDVDFCSSSPRQPQRLVESACGGRCGIERNEYAVEPKHGVCLNEYVYRPWKWFFCVLTPAYASTG